MKKMLLHPGSPGGKGKFVGTVKQSVDATGVARMLAGDQQEQRGALAMLSKYPKALAYVAAYHGDTDVRRAACHLLTDSEALLMVAESSPHWDSVSKSFERLGDYIRDLPLQDCFQVMLSSPIPEHKAKAFTRVEAEIEGKMVSSSGTQYTFSRFFRALDGEEPAEIFEFVNTKEKVRELAVSSSPYTASMVKGRSGTYSPETLVKILDHLA